MQLQQDGIIFCISKIVDSRERLEEFPGSIEPHIKAGLVTLEKSQVKFYRFD